MISFEISVPTAVYFGAGEINRIPELEPALGKKQWREMMSFNSIKNHCRRGAI